MSLSIQTNVASLIAENNIRINSQFQSTTIQRLSSGYRINNSADDAGGLAVANSLQASIAELTQGVLNAQNGLNSLQTVDGGLSNISSILTRLQTLATESASTTFTGNRATLDNEFQTLLTEINRQANNIGLNTGGSNNIKLSTFTGGGTSNSTSQVSVDLSGGNNAVDTAGLAIANFSVAGGGTGISANTVRLDNTATAFLAASNTQAFTFHINTGTGGNQDVTVTLNGGTPGLNGTQVISSLNNQLQAYGITASIGSAGTLQFGGASGFTVSAAAASGGNGVTGAGTAVNTGNYNLGSGVFANFTLGGGTSASESVVFQNAGGTHTVTLDNTNASDVTTALTTLNTALNSAGIYAVKAANGSDISFQSQNAFSANETAYTAGAGGGTGNLFGGVGAQAVTAASANASSTGNALSALSAISTAITNLGFVQGKVGAGQNLLNYAINLAHSQITDESASESAIRDADVAAEAANLTKAQVLQQASLAALAQANSAPQALLSLLKG